METRIKNTGMNNQQGEQTMENTKLSNIFQDLKEKYWDMDSGCTWDGFLNAISEAREYGYQEGKEIWK